MIHEEAAGRLILPNLFQTKASGMKTYSLGYSLAAAISTLLVLTICAEDEFGVVLSERYEPLTVISRRQSNEMKSSDEVFVLLLKDSRSQDCGTVACDVVGNMWTTLVEELNPKLQFAVVDVASKFGGDFVLKFASTSPLPAVAMWNQLDQSSPRVIVTQPETISAIRDAILGEINENKMTPSGRYAKF
jgi:hypothetical protein